MVSLLAGDVASLTAVRRLTAADEAVRVASARLSSGSRLASAADDAAGLTLSEGLRARIGGLAQAVRNAQEGIGVLRTADGALGQSTAVLQRMRDLAVQAAGTGATDAAARAAITQEWSALRGTLDGIAAATASGGRRLLDGTYRGTFQVGPDAGATLTVDLTRSAVSAQSAQDALGTGGWGVFGLDAAGLLGPDPDPGTVLGASWFAGQIAVVDSAVGAVSRVRARLGAVQDGLERTADGLQQELQDTTAARSRITDADLGAEAAALARGRVLVQMGTAVLSHSISASRGLVALLG